MLVARATSTWSGSRPKIKSRQLTEITRLAFEIAILALDKLNLLFAFNILTLRNHRGHYGALVRSVKQECLSKVILFGERSLRRALMEYVDHYHAQRNHQGKGNVLLFSEPGPRA